MSRLTWIERDHGWRAGPYEIELVAPQLWVCSRRRRDGSVFVEFTGGSLSAMKDQAETLSRHRANIRRLCGYIVVLLLGIAGAAFFAEANSTTGSFLVVGLSMVAVVSAVRAIDCVIRRSWESVSSIYQ